MRRPLHPEYAISRVGDSPPSIHTIGAGAGFDPEAAREWLYAFAMQSLDYALLAVDSDKRIRWANPGAGWLLAATQAEIVGRPITEFFTPEDQAIGIPEHEQRSALRQGSSDDDRWMLRADGSRFWATGKTIALSRNDGVPMGFFKIFRDQTEVKMRVDAFAKQASAESTAGATPGPGVGGGRWPLEPELRAAIAEASARIPIGGRHIQVLFPSGASIEVRGDRARLRQAFAALVEHAIRATADDGRIWINGTTEGEQATVHVEDNGLGIAPDRLAGIYDLFTRPVAELADAGTQHSLAGARSAIEAHGGTVQVRSAGPGKGSEFVVNLPLAMD